MGRKSSIHKLTPKVRARIEKHLREDRLTLDEIIADLQAQFPADKLPSRTAVWRQKSKFDDLLRRAREQQEMAAVLVAELGENPDEKAGALMVQSITTLATHASMAAQGNDDVAIEDVRKLARAAKDVIQARKLDRQERVAVRRLALEEAAKVVGETAKAQGMSAEQVEFWRKQVLGIA